jgi:hypothetical protein
MDSGFELSPREQNLVFRDGATTIRYGERGLNWKGVIGYRWMTWRAKLRLNRFYSEALDAGECYYGPFKGEFGHLLLHNLPFLVHLHKQGVRINYCGMELHKPFFVDEAGKDFLHSFTSLRDFFAESKPSANQTILPEDVQQVVNVFSRKADSSGLPFLDISDKDMYWFVFRNWQLNGKQSKYDLSKVYGDGKKNSCVIFPRKKGGEVTPNNGGPWNYLDIAKTVAPYFDEVQFVGHPSLSAEVPSEGNIKARVSYDNADTLKYCAEARLIITQHSGAVHLGSYVNTPVLIIFNGNPPIKGLIDTIRFRRNISEAPLNYAFNMKEIESFVSDLQS